MEKKRISFEVFIFKDREELPSIERRLLQAATVARKGAYAPYSKFRVGAALLLENGELVTGNNQENASYPAGLCAERVAVFQASSRFPGTVIRALAVCVGAGTGKGMAPAAPCGNCRQAMIEYEQRQGSPISLLMEMENGPVFKCGSIADILPMAFNGSFLGES